MDKLSIVSRSNIINFLNWNDRHANIDNSYNDMELVAIMIYVLFDDVLDVNCWNAVMDDYSTLDDMLEALEEVAPEIIRFINNSYIMNELAFKELIGINFKSRI